MVRLGAMGDILHALPAVTALRAAHPEWLIGWAVEPHWAPLLVSRSAGDFPGGMGGGAHLVPAHADGSTAVMNGAPEVGQAVEEFMYSERNIGRQDSEMPVVDRVHLVGARGWGRAPFSRGTWTDIARVRGELRSARYDVCVDLQGAVRSAVVGRWAGAARMIGEDDPREGAARWFFGERVKTAGTHVIEQCLEVAGAVDGEVLPFVAAELPRDSVAEAWCERWLRERFVGLPFVMLNPGAGWGAKRWPSERYGRVAAGLAAMGCGVVVNAGPGESDLASAVIAASVATVRDAAPVFAVSPGLAELISLSRRASLVVAGDTGPLHLANALGRPVVGIFGPTDPARNGPFGAGSGARPEEQFRVLRHPESRRDHSRKSDPETGLLTISVEDVMGAAKELLAGSLSGRSDEARPEAGAAGWEDEAGDNDGSTAVKGARGAADLPGFN